jgi:hypothetical protein
MNAERKNLRSTNAINEEAENSLSVCTSAPHAEMARNGSADEPCEAV